MLALLSYSILPKTKGLPGRIRIDQKSRQPASAKTSLTRSKWPFETPPEVKTKSKSTPLFRMEETDLLESFAIPSQTGIAPILFTSDINAYALLSYILPGLSDSFILRSSLPVDAIPTRGLWITGMEDSPTAASKLTTAGVIIVFFLTNVVPAITSSPAGRMLDPCCTGFLIKTCDEVLAEVNSTGTTQSAPFGIRPPVAICTPLPEVTLILVGEPAGTVESSSTDTGVLGVAD